MERDIEKEVILKFVNKGFDISGESNSESNMNCPNCDSAVGDYEYDELYFNYCPNCGQKLKYTKRLNLKIV